MKANTKGIVLLGSTGSIGTQTLDVVRTFPGHFRIVGLAARRSLDLLKSQVREFAPKYVSCQGTNGEKAILLSDGCVDCRMEEMVVDPEVELVVVATSGDSALLPTLAAIEAGKNIALANKESIAMAGEMITNKAKEYGVSLFPIDSEPSAIWQCLKGEDAQISRLIITASGGAFRDVDIGQLADVTPKQALKHPNWNMGQKITIDSATMMNKAFEVIEAHWLFGVPWENIEVVIHPQSVIHSMVEFVDGSIKASLSRPDMHLPIQYALFHPDRKYNSSINRFNPVDTGMLSFEAWDSGRYPCFDMALEIAKRGGTWPAALSGADDMAVQLFLAGTIGFLEIETVIRNALYEFQSVSDPSIQEALDAAAWARDAVSRVVGV